MFALESVRLCGLYTEIIVKLGIVPMLYVIHDYIHS